MKQNPRIQEGEDVFISYSRKDTEFVRWLDSKLKSEGREAWVDWAGISPGEKWWDAIVQAVDAAHTFIFVLSSNSLASEVCKKEVEQAHRSGKRIVPVVITDVSSVESPIPRELKERNYIFLREQDRREDNIKLLFQSIDKDFEHVKLHTKFLIRAKEWSFHNESENYLLRAGALEEASEWLTTIEGKLPSPTRLHSRHISASRLYLEKQRKRLLFAISAALLLTVGLTILSFVGFSQARSDEKEAKRNAGLSLYTNMKMEHRMESDLDAALYASLIVDPPSREITQIGDRRLLASGEPSLSLIYDSDKVVQANHLLMVSPPLYVWRSPEEDFLKIERGGYTDGYFGWNQDGDRFCTGSSIWDSKTGEKSVNTDIWWRKTDLAETSGRQESGVFTSPSGKNRLEISAEQLDRYTESNGTVAWSPDENLVALGYGYNGIGIYDLNERNLNPPVISNIENTTRGLSGRAKDARWTQEASWSPNGRFLAVYGFEDLVIWDREIPYYPIARNGAFSRLAWSPCSKLMLVGDGKAEIWPTVPLQVPARASLRAEKGVFCWRTSDELCVLEDNKIKIFEIERTGNFMVNEIVLPDEVRNIESISASDSGRFLSVEYLDGLAVLSLSDSSPLGHASLWAGDWKTDWVGNDRLFVQERSGRWVDLTEYIAVGFLVPPFDNMNRGIEINSNNLMLTDPRHVLSYLGLTSELPTKGGLRGINVFDSATDPYCEDRQAHSPDFTLTARWRWEAQNSEPIQVFRRGKLAKEYHPGQRPIVKCIWSPCGKHFVAVERWYMLEASDLSLSYRKHLVSIEESFPPVVFTHGDVDWSPCGNFLAVRHEQFLLLWDVNAGRFTKGLYHSGEGPVWAEDGRFLAMVNYEFESVDVYATEDLVSPDLRTYFESGQIFFSDLTGHFEFSDQPMEFLVQNVPRGSVVLSCERELNEKLIGVGAERYEVPEPEFFVAPRSSFQNGFFAKPGVATLKMKLPEASVSVFVNGKEVATDVNGILYLVSEAIGENNHRCFVEMSRHGKVIRGEYLKHLSSGSGQEIDWSEY